MPQSSIINPKTVHALMGNLRNPNATIVFDEVDFASEADLHAMKFPLGDAVDCDDFDTINEYDEYSGPGLGLTELDGTLSDEVLEELDYEVEEGLRVFASVGLDEDLQPITPTQEEEWDEVCQWLNTDAE